MFFGNGKTDEKEPQGAPELPEDLQVENTTDKQTTEPDFAQPDAVSEEVAAGDVKQTSVNPAWQRPFRAVGTFIVHRKRFSIPLLVLIVVGVLAAVPLTRYKIAGLFVTQSVSLKLVEPTTGKPVSNVDVTLGSSQGKTDAKGEIMLRSKPGKQQVTAKKQYYADSNQTILVPIGTQKQSEVINITATGRKVPVKVIDKISKQPLADVTISALGTETKTEAKGEVIVVLPADKPTVSVTASNGGYVSLTKDITVTEANVAENTLELLPDLFVYMLSNQDSTIDVVKTRLDGSERQVVVSGTGREQNYGTQLVAANDWSHLALLARREPKGLPKLYDIDTKTGALLTVESNEVNIDIVGWSGRDLVYQTTLDHSGNAPDNQLIKTYNADTKRVSIIARSAGPGADGSGAETFGASTLLGSDVVFSRSTEDMYGSNIKVALMSVKATGGDARALKEWSGGTYISTASSGPNELRFATNREVDNSLYAIRNGSVSTVSGKSATDLYDDQMFAYMISPSSDLVAWSDVRDGKSVISTRNIDGSGEKKAATLASGYGLYGFVSNKYLVVFRDSTLSAIATDAVSQADVTPVQIGGFYGEIGNTILYGKRLY